MASKDMDVSKIDVTDIPNGFVGSDRDVPLVFRCISCGTIVGDSTDWITANEKQRSITLIRVTSKVQCGRTMLSSVTGEDMGSAYHVLKCNQCDTELGKIYRTTSSHMDDLRNRFTFDVDKIDSYQVGHAEQGVSDTGDVFLTVPMAKTVLAKISKLQSTLSTLEERVSALENASQSNSAVKEEFTIAENNITLAPSSVDSVRNGPVMEASQADSGPLKRRSHAAGLYVASSPQTSKRSKMH